MISGAGRGGKRGLEFRQVASYAVIAGAVWLGWEVVKQPVVLRAPPALAIRLSPGSPEVLQRAAESELLQNRPDNARALSEASLAGAPFNARAMRVRGLSEARIGDSDQADELLTLAGNWSLRDDPTHAWLIENRLRRGDYHSAFAHADTLVRRRPDLYPSIFRLFSSAAAQDPRALPALVDLLAKNPEWRIPFLEHLHKDPAGAPVVGALAIALQRTKAPLTSFELQRLYDEWLKARRIVGLRQIRETLNRPPVDRLLQNGDFSEDLETQAYPFGWRIGAGPGIVAGVAEDDLREGNTAFRLAYDGFGSGAPLEQMLMLRPGTYAIDGAQRVEASPSDLRLRWSLDCAESGQSKRIIDPAVPPKPDAGWTRFSSTFTVPAEHCSVQWLRLSPVPGDRRTNIAVWYDDIRIRAASPTSTARPAVRGS